MCPSRLTPSEAFDESKTVWSERNSKWGNFGGGGNSGQSITRVHSQLKLQATNFYTAKRNSYLSLLFAKYENV